MQPQAAAMVGDGRGGTAVAAPGVLVILGASGDLTKRLLMPALYNLACEGLLPEDFAVVGMARRDMTTAEFRGQQREDIARFSTRRSFDADRWQWLESRLHYVAGEFADAAAYAASAPPAVDGVTTLLLQADDTGEDVRRKAAAAFNLAGGFVPMLGKSGSWAYTHWTARAFVAIVYLALFPSITAYVCYAWAVPRVGHTIAGMFSNVTAILGALFAIVFLGEEGHLYHLLALLLVSLGVYLVSTTRKNA